MTECGRCGKHVWMVCQECRFCEACHDHSMVVDRQEEAMERRMKKEETP